MRGLSPVAASGGHSSSRCTGLSLSRPLLLWSTGSRCAGSAIVAHRPSRSAACGILPDQGSNPCPLHWQADSQPLCHQGSPAYFLYWVVWAVCIFWILTACHSHHLQIFFPFHRLSFHFLCCAKAFIFAFISFTLGDWSKKIFLRFMSKSILAMFSSWSFMWANVLISLFYMWLSSFPSASCWRACLFSIVYSCLLCHRLIDHRYVGLFLGSLFHSIDLCVCFCANTMLFWWL